MADDETVGDVPVGGGPSFAGNGSSPPDSLDEGASEAASVDLGELLDAVCRFLKKYVIFSSSEQVDALALWIAHSHALEAFDVTPYVNICSETKRAAKTRTLEVVELVVPNPWRVVDPTKAVLFRKIARCCPTLLLDEVDTVFGEKASAAHAGLRGVLNAGYRRGATVPRCVGKEQEVIEFEVFCPKLMAGIGELPDTVSDRSIRIQLRRRLRSEPVARFYRREAKAAAAPLREALERWGRITVNALRAGRPAPLDALNDRAAEIWLPLLSISDIAGGTWPARARSAAVELHADADARDAAEADKRAAAVADNTSQVEKAAAFLHTVLADGPLPQATVLAKATDAGVAPRTLLRAKDSLGVRSRRDGKARAWTWQLPPANGAGDRPTYHRFEVPPLT